MLQSSQAHAPIQNLYKAVVNHTKIPMLRAFSQGNTECVFILD